ncbi:MAG: hypothetical protein GY841_14175 [FCB group bacterium]|nr:hypothetical protein [FCB group bacterium]
MTSPIKYPSHKGLSLIEISPHEWPCRVGEITILLSKKVGYCALVREISRDTQEALVSLLDYTKDDLPFTIPLYDCIPTRKGPEDLISQYHLTPQQFSDNLSKERSFPDFDSPAISKSRKKSLNTKSTKKKKKLEGAELLTVLAGLSEEQKKALGKIMKKSLSK